MRTAVAAALLAAALIACRGDDEVTAVRIKAVYGSARTFNQFAFALGSGAAPDFAMAEVKPTTAGGRLLSPQDFVIYVSDDLDGRQLSCGVEGRSPSQAPLRSSRSVTVQRRRVVDCAIHLDPIDGGSTAGDGSVERPPGDGGSGLTDGPPSDSLLPTDMGALPEPPRTDAPVDSPVPVDMPVDPMPPVETGCRQGNRRAFRDRVTFPDIAACGTEPVSFQQAVQSAGTVCADGWHFCRPQEVGALTTSQDPDPDGGSCSWLVSTLSMSCGQKLQAHPSLQCQGTATVSASTAGPMTGTLPCQSLDLTGCTHPWKLAIPLSAWNSSSLQTGGDLVGCLNHVGFQCASAVGGATCWISCCKD